ncbi:MAG: UPF0149 family protein [Woeseiaceae bacterium]
MAETYGSDFLLTEQLLAQLDIEVTASEADGRLTGLAAMLGPDAMLVWLQDLLSGDDNTVDALRIERAEPLRLLAAKRLDVIEQGEGLPVLCLPDDDDDIRDRVDALAHWSTGFLSGLGEGAALRGAAAREQIQQEPLSELIRDLTEITQAEIADEDLQADPEGAETAYTELVEFLRVACQLAYDNLHAMRVTQESSEPQQVH